jgi:hypothetical protein
MSKVYTGLLVVVTLFAMAALGTLILVAIADVSHLAFPTESPGMSPCGVVSTNVAPCARVAPQFEIFRLSYPHSGL